MRRLFWILGGVFLFGLAALGLILMQAGSRVEAYLLEVLEERTGRSVEMGSLRWSLRPSLSLESRDLKIGSLLPERDPPLLTAERIAVEAAPWRLLSRSPRFSILRLEGLDIYLPAHEAPPQEDPERGPVLPTGGALLFERIVLEDARIRIASEEPGEEPLLYHIRHVSFDATRLDGEAFYEARLDMPRARGLVVVEGRVGPWLEQIALTPLDGRFTLDQADLKGLGEGLLGVLSAEGRYEGTLQRVFLEGSAQVPDFALARVGRVVPLTARFEVRLLQEERKLLFEEISFRLRDSSFRAEGELDRTGEPRLQLQLNSEEAWIEHLVELSVPAEEAPLEGRLDLNARVDFLASEDLPPLDQLTSEGTFTLRDGRFTRFNLERELARVRALGREETVDGNGTPIERMEGEFRLRGGVLHFSRLLLGIGEGRLELTGSYDLALETLDFRGRLELAKALSELVPEPLSRWARILDPVLRRGEAGTVLPIRITGSRSRPQLSLDTG